MHFFSLIAAASVVIPVLASPLAQSPKDAPTREEVWKSLQQRDVASCNHDNLYRIFLDNRYKASASVFCSAYIGKTTTATVSTIATTLTTTTTSANVATITETVKTTTTTNIPLETITSTETIYQKRAAGDATPTPPGPAATYPASRLSSACSCLVTPGASTVTTTATGKATVTSVSVVQLTASTTVTEVQTVTENNPAKATATQTLNFCDYTTLKAKSDNAIFQVRCGTSYTNLVGGYLQTVPQAQACFDICDADLACRTFTFSKGLAVDNCYLVRRTGDGIPDANAQSAVFTGF